MRLTSTHLMQDWIRDCSAETSAEQRFFSPYKCKIENKKPITSTSARLA